MKKKLYVLLLTGLVAAGATMAQSKLSGDFTLHVDVSSLKPRPGKFMFYRKGVNDSADVTNGKVVFRGKLAEPTMAVLFWGSRLGMLYLEPGNIRVIIKDSMNIVVSGSRSQRDFEKLMAMRKPYEDKEDQLYKQREVYSKAGDTAGISKTAAGLIALVDELNEKVYKPFVIEYGNKSAVAIWALRAYAGYGDGKFSEVEQLFTKIGPAYRALPSAKDMEDQIEIAKKTAIGKYAMDFTQNDTLGQPVTLSSFRGRYVLLDFWASWCGPCRRENPNLVRSFNRFRDKGFTVLSVSLDQPGKKDEWMKAIQEDHLTWTHVSDLGSWNNAVAKLYGVRGIPANLLIDPQGRIVAKDLRGGELDKKLAEIFD